MASKMVDIDAPASSTTVSFVKEERKVATGTQFRLDTADMADGAGWFINSNDHLDEFTKDGVAIEVQYSLTDDIEKLVRRSPSGEVSPSVLGSDGGWDLLQHWLTGRPLTGKTPLPNGKRAPIDFAQKPGDWTRQEFIDAVVGASDRAFLLKFLALVDANDRLPAEGPAPRLFFGKRPGGSVFVYPFGRGYPPFKFSIKNGGLMISGCWKGNFKVSGHAGFGEIAALLGQDESGSASAVPVTGFDPDEVWNVGDRASCAVNL